MVSFTDLSSSTMTFTVAPAVHQCSASGFRDRCRRVGLHCVGSQSALAVQLQAAHMTTAADARHHAKQPGLLALMDGQQAAGVQPTIGLNAWELDVDASPVLGAQVGEVQILGLIGTRVQESDAALLGHFHLHIGMDRWQAH